MSIYLDYNATAPIDPAVAAQLPEWVANFGNPSSVHGDGRRAKVALETARSQVAEALGIPTMDVLFTSGGTESNNWALFQILRTHSPLDPAHLIVSAIEHSCILNAAKFLEAEGVQVTRVKPDGTGLITVSALEAELRPNTRLISVMTANNETGVIQPISELTAMAQSRNIPFHSDAVQALGKIPIDFTAPGLTLATLSGHKLGALKGIGALIARDSSDLRPWAFGGGHEFGKRSGTENLLGILSLGEVMSRLSEKLAQDVGSKMTEFRDHLRQKWPEMWLSGEHVAALPNTLCLAYPGLNGRSLMMNLDINGISVSTGSACATGSIEPSHVLTAMGLDQWIIDGAIRISIGATTSHHELEETAAVIGDCIAAIG